MPSYKRLLAWDNRLVLVRTSVESTINFNYDLKFQQNQDPPRKSEKKRRMVNEAKQNMRVLPRFQCLCNDDIQICREALAR